MFLYNLFMKIMEGVVNMDLANVISNNIQQLLDMNKASISEISTYLEISRQTMTNYLKGVSVIDSVQLAKIADFFDVPIETFFSCNKEENANTLIFRTALNYSEAVNNIQDHIFSCINEYMSLAKTANKQTCYFPEQYNLTLNTSNEQIDINFECNNFFDTKLRLNSDLQYKIAQIANEQRQLLNLGDKGAISLIQALTQRGINVIFTDLGDTDISGLSLCNESKGCFIFVNSNENFTVERQLFTVAHEYGHILLHRPIYKRKIQQQNSSKYNILDAMADCFAGYLLCPETILSQYATTLQPIKNNINSIYRIIVPLKLKLQISFQSLLLSLRNYGYITQSVVSEYFRAIEISGNKKKEPNPIANNPDLYNSYLYASINPIVELIHTLYIDGILTMEEALGKLYFFNVKQGIIDNLTNEWASTNTDFLSLMQE